MHTPSEIPSDPSPILDTRRPDPDPSITAGAPEIELAVDGEQAVAWMSGEIDLANARHLLELGTLALAEPRIDALVLDLSRVTFLDSSGLGAMVELRNHAQRADKRLALRGATPPVYKVLELTGLIEAFGLSLDDDPGRC